MCVLCAAHQYHTQFFSFILFFYCMLIESMGRFIGRVTCSSSLSLKNWALPSRLWIGCGRCRPSLLKRGDTRQGEHMRDRLCVYRIWGEEDLKSSVKQQSSDQDVIKRCCLWMGVFSSISLPHRGEGIESKREYFQSISYYFGVRRSRNLSFTSRTTSVALVSGSLIFTCGGGRQHLQYCAVRR